jgi:hypothetical protein
VGTYRGKLSCVANAQEDLGVKRIAVVFGHLFELGVDGYELNHGHHGHLCIESLEGQVGLLKGIKGTFDGKFELPVYDIGIWW